MGHAGRHTGSRGMFNIPYRDEQNPDGKVPSSPAALGSCALVKIVAVASRPTAGNSAQLARFRPPASWLPTNRPHTGRIHAPTRPNAARCMFPAQNIAHQGKRRAGCSAAVDPRVFLGRRRPTKFRISGKGPMAEETRQVMKRPQRAALVEHLKSSRAGAPSGVERGGGGPPSLGPGQLAATAARDLRPHRSHFSRVGAACPGEGARGIGGKGSPNVALPLSWGSCGLAG
jgi:hypothetical protein